MQAIVQRLWSSSFLQELLSEARDLSAADVGAVYDEARRLAVAAYRDGDRDERVRAERFLHGVHTSCSGAVPTRPLPALVWTVLVEHKLRAADEMIGAVDDVDIAALPSLVADEQGSKGLAAHPLYGYVQNTPGLGFAPVVAKNLLIVNLVNFDHNLVGILQRSPAGAKEAALKNVVDEIAGEPHSTMRVTFGKTLGVDAGKLSFADDADVCLEALELSNLRTALCAGDDPWAAMGSFYAMEATSAKEISLWVAELRRRGMSDNDMRYLTTHGDVDPGHANEWMDGVKACDPTPRACASFLRGAKLQLTFRYRLFDAVLRRLEEQGR